MLERIAMFFKGILDYLKSDICIFNNFKEALCITNNNIIIATPLIMFIMILGTYLRIVPADNLYSMTLVLFLFFAMSAVFFSGWFYSIKLAIEQKHSKDDSLYLLKQFPSGVGEYFINYFLMILIFFIMLTFIVIFTYKSALVLIGSIGISRPELFLALSSPDAMYNLISSLPSEQLVKLSYWNMYFFLTTTIYSFMVMLWAPEIIYQKKATMRSFIDSFVKLIKVFFKALTVFSFLMLLYFIITILSAILKGQLLSFIVLVIYFYYIVYSAVLIFLFYKKEFVENE